jgi:hypothetical protein
VRVARAFVTTGVDADGARVRERIDEDPSVAATTTTSIVVAFDRYLDPRTAIRQSFCLQSDADAPPPVSAEQCLSGITLTPTYDPVTRTVTLYLDEPLSATTHTLTVFAPLLGTSFGIRAFDSARLDSTVTFTFDTLEANPAGTEELEAPADLDPGIVTCDDAEKLFLGCAGCHGSSNGPDGLSLDATGIAAAIDRVAHQTSLADHGSEAAARPVTFGAGMPVIERNSPGNSYIIYKVLARARYSGEGMAEGELERLQSFIVGSPMPAHEVDVFGEDATMTQANLKQISAWIAAGASCDQAATAAPSE